MVSTGPGARRYYELTFGGHDLRAMLHDESVYPDPFTFKPERFLTEDGLSLNTTARDPGHAIWGFGRRWGFTLLFFFDL